MREAPVIESWRSSCRVDASQLPVSEAFQLGRSLYFLQPRWEPVPLCNKPDVAMRVHSADLPKDGVPTAVTLKKD